MTPHRHWLRNYRAHHVPVELADSKDGGKRLVYSSGIGTCVFNPVINGILSRTLEFSDVLHVPDLGNNLFSILTLTEHKDFTVHIAKGSMSFSKQGRTHLTAFITPSRVAYLCGTVEPAAEHAHIASTLPMDYDLWHRRPGHLNFASLKQMSSQNRAKGLEITSSANRSTTPYTLWAPLLDHFH